MCVLTRVGFGIVAVLFGWIGSPELGFAAAPIAYRHLAYEYDVQADGRYTETIHGEIRANNSAAASNIGQVPLGFSESLEDLTIGAAYTLKANGKKLPVDPRAIFAQLQPGSPDVALFNDQKQKVIIFPDVGAGDSVVWTSTIHTKQPLLRGEFMAQKVFERTVEYDDVQVVVRVPKSLPLNVETHDLAFDKESEGDTIVYHWRYASRDAEVEDPASVSAFDRLPRLFISTFHSYDAFAAAYAKLIKGKVAVTPKVQALADEITAGISNRRQQTQAIYDWVSRHIRYVAVVLRNGGLVPHEPDLIIANGYGDCKDHTVLFASLLKAKGIASELVLINGDNSYTLSNVPTLAQLDHAISWLPELGLYADTTAGLAPFGSLPLEEYGKPVVHVVTSGHALRKTPILSAGSASQTVRTVAKLSANGVISGTSVTTATGPLSTMLRGDSGYIQANGPERVAKMVLGNLGEEGSGGFEMDPIGSLSPSYTISGHFKLAARPRIVSGESFIPPVGLQVLSRPGDGLVGPLNLVDLKEDEPTPCFSGSQIEELSLELPPGKRVAKIPKDTSIESNHMRYTAHWAIAGPFLTVRREFKSNIDQPLCTGKTRREAALALSQIREDYRATVALTNR
jgi:transglutaminase-like putative cysteine protease